MPDRIDAAVSRLNRAASHQRRVEAVAVGLLLVFVVVFQLGNRATFLGAQNRANRDAATQRKAFSRKLDEQGVKLDEANRRVGQLESALKAAGLQVPDPLPSSAPPSSTTTTTPRRTTTTLFGPRPATTSTTASTTTTTTAPGKSPPRPTTTTQPPCTTLPQPVGRCVP